jgi:hypothetical protein
MKTPTTPRWELREGPPPKPSKRPGHSLFAHRCASLVRLALKESCACVSSPALGFLPAGDRELAAGDEPADLCLPDRCSLLPSDYALGHTESGGGVRDAVLPLELVSQRGRHLTEEPVHVGAGLAKVAEARPCRCPLR